MTEAPGLLLTIAAFALLLSPLVFFHELGHYLAGRLFGVKAEVFSIGFGREILGVTDRRGTRWKLGWLPLGGYVRFAGDADAASTPSNDWLMMPPEERAKTLPAKPVWQRAIIVAAGPFANILLAVLILAGFAYAYGDVRTPATVGQVVAGSPAAKAGLRPADRIAAVDGRSVDRFEQLVMFVAMRPGETVRLTIDRGGRSFDQPVTFGERHERDRFGNDYRIGNLGILAAQPHRVPVSLAQAPGVGARRTADILATIVDTMKRLVTGRQPVDQLGGPLRIAKVAGESLSLGWPEFVSLAALISINLGFINLLPVPMLDGGHLLLYAIEGVRRRPIGEQAQEWVFRGGLAAILALMILVTVNDLGSFGLWRGLAGLIG